MFASTNAAVYLSHSYCCSLNMLLPLQIHNLFLLLHLLLLLSEILLFLLFLHLLHCYHECLCQSYNCSYHCNRYSHFAPSSIYPDIPIPDMLLILLSLLSIMLHALLSKHIFMIYSASTKPLCISSMMLLFLHSILL